MVLGSIFQRKGNGASENLSDEPRAIPASQTSVCSILLIASTVVVKGNALQADLCLTPLSVLSL